MNRSSVLWVGEASSPELADVLCWLRDHVHLSIARSATAVLGENDVTTSQVCDLIIFCQSRPGQFSATDVEQLQRRFPLARILAFVGNHCEGEMRSGSPWPGVPRVYWCDWRPRFETEILQRRHDHQSPWELVRTAAEPDLALADVRWEKLRRAVTENRRPIRVAIHAQTSAAMESLGDACRALRLEVFQTLSPSDLLPSAFDVLIWDAERFDEAERALLAEVSRQVSPRPVVLVCGFPRPEDCQAAIAAGAHAVLAKPFLLRDLEWHIEHATSVPGSHGTADAPVFAATEPRSAGTLKKIG